MDSDALRSTAVEILAVISAVAAAIATLRGRKNASDTEAAIEAAKQGSITSALDTINDLRATLAAERHRADEASTLSTKREANLVAINDHVRSQFGKSLDEFREALGARDNRIGTLIEDVAEWRGRAEALQAEKLDLQAAIQRQRNDCNEEKRALTAGYERQLSSLNAEISTLTDSNHRLTNQLYGDGTATNIMGPSK